MVNGTFSIRGWLSLMKIEYSPRVFLRAHAASHTSFLPPSKMKTKQRNPACSKLLIDYEKEDDMML
jgi:hypothetical protein